MALDCVTKFASTSSNLFVSMILRYEVHVNRLNVKKNSPQMDLINLTTSSLCKTRDKKTKRYTHHLTSTIRNLYASQWLDHTYSETGFSFLAWSSLPSKHIT